MSSANRVLLLLFQSGFLLFLSLLIAVAKTSTTMLNSSGESGHLCLVPDFRGNAFNLSPLRIMFAVGLSYMVSSLLNKDLLIPHQTIISQFYDF